MRKTLLLLVLVAGAARASVPSEASSSGPYTCTGASTGPFSVIFPFQANAHLSVFRTELATGASFGLTLGTDYTVAGAGGASGSVTLVGVDRCPSGYTLTIERTIPLTQPWSIPTAGPYSAKAHEKAFDRLTEIAQQLDRDRQDLANVVGTGNPDASFAKVIATGASAARTLADELADVVNPKRFGAKGDGVTDDAAAIQRAVNVAALSASTVVFPPGTYRVDSAISLPSSVRLVGSSYRPGTTIQAGAAIAAIIEIAPPPPAPPGQSVGPFDLRDLHLDGANLAATCIRGVASSHVLLERMKLRRSTTHAIEFGYGWNWEIVETQISNNAGDGVYGDGSPADQQNAFNIIASKITSNTGWGVRMAGPHVSVVNVIASSFEANAAGAIFFEQGAGPVNVIGSYFESNAATGHTFTTPALTVKADIVLNGGTGTTLATTTPVRPVNVEGCMFSGTASSPQGHVYIGGARNVRFVGNRHTTSGFTTKAFVLHGQATYSFVPDVVMEGNVDFDEVPAFIGGYGPSNGIPTLGWDTWRIRGSQSAQGERPRRNYYPQDISQHSPIAAGTGGTYRRSADSYFGWPGYEITGVDGVSDRFGITIDVDVNTELRGQLMYAAAWTKVDDPATHAAARWYTPTNGGGSTQSYFTFTSWRLQVLYWIAPTSGTFTIGFEKYAAAGSGAVRAIFAKPVVAVVGVPYQDFFPDPPPATVSWRGASAPAGGTWGAGDLIANSSPGIGAAPGWICTAGGAPGTWVPLPLLAAVSADRGDASQTLTAGVDAPVQRWATALTANRTVTCSATGAVSGSTFRVVRSGLGAFTLDVCGVKTVPNATAAFVDVAFDGAAWRLTGYGVL